MSAEPTQRPPHASGEAGLSQGAKITRYERALPSMDEVFVRVVKPA